jgi:hypothetical protein
MISFTQPGPVAAGWHPDHGFHVLGAIRDSAANILVSKGFRRGDEDGFVLLTLPQDTSEHAGRDMIAAACAVLIASKHHVVADLTGLTSPQDEQAQASLTELLPTLQTYRDRVLATIRSLHPGVGCLPVPVLSTPDHPADLDATIDALTSRLTSVTTDGTPVWMHAARSCNSLVGKRTLAALHALIIQWSAVLEAVRLDLIADGGRDLKSTTQQFALLDARLRTAADMPMYDHEVTSGTLSQLNPGDVFSVDYGATWQVCSGVPFGAVPVYTGEHDDQGVPVQDHFHAGWDVSSCLVRSAPVM